MLTISTDDHVRLFATQRDSSPTVYLDHWALRDLSTTPGLAERFVAALKQRNGTLTLSCTNLIEFCNVTDDQQARRAEELLEASLPHVFFLEMDPFLVQKREDELLRGGPPRPPHEDRELFMTLFRLKPQTVSVFTARTLLDGVRSGIGRQANELADTIVQQVGKLRRRTEITVPSFGDSYYVVRACANGPNSERNSARCGRCWTNGRGASWRPVRRSRWATGASVSFAARAVSRARRSPKGSVKSRPVRCCPPAASVAPEGAANRSRSPILGSWRPWKP